MVRHEALAANALVLNITAQGITVSAASRG